MKKMLIALMLGVVLATAHAEPSLIKAMKKDGVIMMANTCSWKGQAFICMIVSLHDEKYVVLGVPEGEKFVERYIFKAEGNKAKEVWRYTDRES